jgi:outer membrane protein assembly factor BamB
MVEEDTVYFAYGPHAYAVDLDSGTQRWQFPVEAERGADFYAAPVLADQNSQLLISGYDKTLHSLDPGTGIEQWEFTGAGDRYIDSPLIVNETIFAPNSDDTLYALDLDGSLKWTFETGDPLWASPVWSEDCSCLYQASMDHHLYAINPENGELVWKTEDLGGPIVNSPALSDNGLIILGNFNNEVLALDEETQQVVWKFQTADWVWASPAIDDQQVYISDISGTFYSLDLESGTLEWQIQPGGGIFTEPLVTEELIYFSTDASSLVVVNKDGVIQRNQPVEGKLYAKPASAGDKLLLTPVESEYYLLALNESGVQVWGFPPAE